MCALLQFLGDQTGRMEHLTLNRSVYEFEVPAESGRDTPINYWNRAYEAIAAANHALEAIEKATKNKADYLPYKGEALLCRAYAHFMLVTLFSKVYDRDSDNSSPGIPYVTTPEIKVQPTYNRNTVAYVYEMIEKDLVEGLKLINNSVYKVAPKFHFTTNAAHAFASRFYLFKREYQQVVKHSSLIVPDGNFKGFLRPWISTYNSWDNAQTREWYANSDQRSNLLLLETTSLWGRNYYTLRFGLTLDLNSQRMLTNTVTGAPWGQTTSSYNNSVNRRHNKFVSHNISTSLTSTSITRRTIIPALTTEETLFNRAEAYANLGMFEEALADLNSYASERIKNYNATTHQITLAKIAAYYGSTEDKEGLIRTILDFRRSEFIQEGIRWFDILRHKITVTHNLMDEYGKVAKTIQIDENDPRRLFQIPEEAKLAGIELNPRP